MSIPNGSRAVLIAIGVALATSAPVAPACAGELVDLIDTLDPPTMPGAPASVAYGKIPFAECFTDWMTFDPTDLGAVEVLSRPEEHDLEKGTMSAMMLLLATNSGRKTLLTIDCGSGVATVTAQPN